MLLLALLGAGCAGPADAELLELRSVTPAHFEPGSEMQIEGRGFPAGREGEVRLEGVYHAPGASPRRVRVERSGRALTTRRLQLHVDTSLIERLGGRGTFHGTLRVRFAGRVDGAAVTGRLDGVELDFAPAAARQLPQRLSHARRGRALLSALGIRLDGDHDGKRGLAVAAVRPGSHAAQIGLTDRDRLVTLSGVRLRTVADFVAPPGADDAEVRFARAGHADPLRASIPLAGLGRDHAEASAALVLGGVALLVALLWFGPLAGPVACFATTVAPRRREHVPPPTPPTRQWWCRALRRLASGGELAATAAALAAVPLWIRGLGGELDVAVLLVVAALVRWSPRLVQLHAATRARPRDGAAAPGALAPPASGGAPRGAAGALVRAVPLLAAAVVAITSTGTMRLGAIVDHQAAAPWGWIVFTNPAALVVLPALLISVVGPGERSGLLPQIAEAAHRLVGAGLVAALLLGGWQCPAHWPLAVAVAAFVLKALALVELGRRIRVTPRALHLSALCALGTMALSMMWIGGHIPPAVRAATGPVLCAAALATVLRVVLVHRRLRAADAGALRVRVLF